MISKKRMLVYVQNKKGMGFSVLFWPKQKLTENQKRGCKAPDFELDLGILNGARPIALDNCF